MRLHRTAAIAAALVSTGTAAGAAYPTPQWHATSRTDGHRAVFAGTFNLDPHRACAKFDYSQDPNLEPDLGPAGGDICGAPDQVTVTLRLYKGRQLVLSAARATAVKSYRGRWTLAVPCRGTRWVATLVNPWQGTNGTATGSLRC